MRTRDVAGGVIKEVPPVSQRHMIGDTISDEFNKRHENYNFITIVLLGRLYSQNITLSGFQAKVFCTI